MFYDFLISVTQADFVFHCEAINKQLKLDFRTNVNPLSVNPIKWSITPKQFVGNN